MTRLFAFCCAAAIALWSLSVPAAATTLTGPPIVIPASDLVVQVSHRHGFYSVRGVYYYNGHRGFVVARPGYRYYRGYWFPPAAFAAGVVVGGAMAHPLPAPRLTAAHIRWCFDRYRSYRAYDNTYQPYEGPREQCWSPYN